MVPLKSATNGGPIRAVLFDLDHTLFDTDRTEREAMRAVAAHVNLALTPRAFTAYQRINREVWALYRASQITSSELRVLRFARWLKWQGRDTAGAETLSRVYLGEFSSRRDLMAGAVPALQALKRLGVRLGVVTNGIDRVQRKRLRQSGIDGFFQGRVVTSEKAGFTKPDPRIMAMALDRLRVAAHETVYVGDDLEVDGGAALAAGMRFLWFSKKTSGRSRAWKTVTPLNQLPLVLRPLVT